MARADKGVLWNTGHKFQRSVMCQGSEVLLYDAFFAILAAGGGERISGGRHSTHEGWAARF